MAIDIEGIFYLVYRDLYNLVALQDLFMNPNYSKTEKSDLSSEGSEKCTRLLQYVHMRIEQGLRRCLHCGKVIK